VTESPDDRADRKLTAERAALWILGTVLVALLVFTIVIAVLT
jgi:hypothetical protein